MLSKTYISWRFMNVIAVPIDFFARDIILYILVCVKYRLCIYIYIFFYFDTIWHSLSKILQNDSLRCTGKDADIL